jgi:hypothetical protein
MMSVAAELACAARALSAERLHLPDTVLVEEWLKVGEAVDEARSDGAAKLWVLHWRRTLDDRLADRNLPHGGGR